MADKSNTPQSGKTMIAAGQRLDDGAECAAWVWQVAVATAVARAEDRVPMLPERVA
jgi:hypothetical protein